MRDFYEWYLAAGLEVVNLNNAGDPMTDEPWAMSSHVFEREVIDYFAPLYGFDKSDVWGIVKWYLRQQSWHLLWRQLSEEHDAAATGGLC